MLLRSGSMWKMAYRCRRFNVHYLLSCRDHSTPNDFFSSADPLWPCVKVKVIERSMSIYQKLFDYTLPFLSERSNLPASPNPANFRDVDSKSIQHMCLSGVVWSMAKAKCVDWNHSPDHRRCWRKKSGQKTSMRRVCECEMCVSFCCSICTWVWCNRLCQVNSTFFLSFI